MSTMNFRKRLPLFIIATVFITTIVVALLLLRSSNGQHSKGAKLTMPSVPASHQKGELNAPIRLDEFGDYQCPACRRANLELKQIEAEFGTRLRVTFRHYPIVKKHQNALSAAYAAEAAGNQGKFWEMHDLLFERQEQWATESDPIPLLTEYATLLQLDVERFRVDVTGAASRVAVEDDRAFGNQIGVRSAPTLFLNGNEITLDQLSPSGLRKALGE